MVAIMGAPAGLHPPSSVRRLRPAWHRLLAALRRLPALPPGAAAIAGCLLLHRCEVLPARPWLWGCVVVGALVWATAVRRGPVWLAPAVASVFFGMAGLRAHQGLAERLPESLEGRDLIVTGLVEQLPQVDARATRFVLWVEECVLAEADAGGVRRSRSTRSSKSSRGRVASDLSAAWKGSSPSNPSGLSSPSNPLGLSSPPGPSDPVHTDVCPSDVRLRLAWPTVGTEAARRSDDSASADDVADADGGARASPSPRVAPGERWRLRVRLRRPHATVNPGLFDAELRALEEGIGAIGTVRAGGAERLAAFVWTPRTAIERLRGRIRERIASATAGQPPVVGGVLVALVIGDQAAIPARWWERFNNTGIGHLMSISGLHITMTAALVAGGTGFAWRSRRLARWLNRVGSSPGSRGKGLARLLPRSPRRSLPSWLPRRPVTMRLPLAAPVLLLDRQVAQWIAAVATAFGYSALAGWGIPAQRTCWMLALAGAAMVSGRGNSMASVLLTSAAVIAVFDPWAPLAAGFWLSFAAVAAIVWFHDQRRAGRHRPVRWREMLSTQFAVTVALIPLGGLFFGAASLVGPLVNLLAIPLVSGLVTPLALAGAALQSVIADAGMPMLWLAALATRGLSAGIEWFDGWPAAVHVLAPASGLPLLLAGLAAAWLLAPVRLPARWWAAGGMLPLLFSPAERPASGELWLTALDVGQGMAILVETPQRRLLYDTGPSLGPDNDAGARTIVPYLRSRGIRELDALVVSHLDDDHSGGALSVLRGMPVGRVASSLADDHPIVRTARTHHRCRRGETFTWGEVSFDWLHPPDVDETSRRSATNARSCVLRIRSVAGTALLPGDLERAQERRLLELYPPAELKADVLFVPHHGSATSSSLPFLHAVDPSIAVFQVGYRNRFRHPDAQVLARYRGTRARLLRSDAHGAIRIVLKAQVEPGIWRSRIDEPRYWRVPVAG